MRRIRRIGALVVLGLLVGVSAIAATDVVANPVQVEWTRQFGSPGEDYANGIALDDSENLYIVGYTTGELPDQTQNGERDAFLRKYDSAGNEMWTEQFGTPEDDEAKDVAVDGSGNIYVAGWTEGEFPGQSQGGKRDAFVRKYNSAGDEMWTLQFDWFDKHDYANAVAVDGLENSYVGGDFDEGYPEDPDMPDPQAYVKKYDSDGNHVTGDYFMTLYCPESVFGIAVDNAGNVVIVGATFGSLFGQNIGYVDAFIGKYDSDLNEIKSLQFGTPEYDYALKVAVDDTGNAYVAGHTEGVLPGQSSGGGRDAFVRMYDPVLNEIWTQQFGTTEHDEARAVALDASGNVYVVGYTGDVLPGQSPKGGNDAYVVKFGQPAEELCPLSKGFWKKHSEDWPVDSLDLGNETYDKEELLDILSTPPRGDASLILAHQLIASKLNVAHGSDVVPIASDISDGDAWLSQLSGRLPYGLRPSSDAGKDMTATAEALDVYNNRNLTPACTRNEDDDDNNDTDYSNELANNEESTGRTQSNGEPEREILDDIAGDGTPNQMSFFWPMIGILALATGTALIVRRRSKENANM
ncbi:MAG: SBBP repeat-containing protein [Methanobacteriota archaeon]|nr:MAG: SBBP repeat-containing protein [Euryarchaeota archaeon]